MGWPGSRVVSPAVVGFPRVIFCPIFIRHYIVGECHIATPCLTDISI
jgi:hypothetical protein